MVSIATRTRAAVFRQPDMPTVDVVPFVTTNMMAATHVQFEKAPEVGTNHPFKSWVWTSSYNVPAKSDKRKVAKEPVRKQVSRVTVQGPLEAGVSYAWSPVSAAIRNED